MSSTSIIYTVTDEAPMLATYSLLPIVQAFCRAADVRIETRDISLAGRIIAVFSDQLDEEQRQNDDLAELGELAKTPQANIIKLPNISASIPQLTAAIRELRNQGYELPEFRDEPRNDDEKAARQRYARVLGSAVNPVLREGNSDRRVAAAVKAYAKKNPHSMGEWRKDSRTAVASMSAGDFYESERSTVCKDSGRLRIEHVAGDDTVTVLREGIPVQPGEVVDAAFMDCRALREFYAEQIEAAKAQGVLLSLHLKATMMKVSDPILFGHAVRSYYADVFDRHGRLFEELGVDADNGIGDAVDKIADLPEARRKAVEDDIAAVYASRPPLAMVDSDRGITNLHVPSNVIIDASMPAAIRAGGKMWGPDGKLHDTLALIPDRCYAGIYAEIVDYCKRHGAFDVTTMGNVSNVGLMAQKAEEYGSHDKTFEVAADGRVRVVDDSGRTLMQHDVRQGDVWRMCQTRDIAIRDWVKLAVNRARATGAAAIFWLDENRAHDRELIGKVKDCLSEHDTDGLDIRIHAPVEAMRATLERVSAGQDTISVTGNVLRDYLTDLFPILELGTSAKMLSIVPLLAGGGLYETGAGGSAPKHVQQFLEENHLRWDSLGEFLALAVSIEDHANATANSAARVVAKALDAANSRFLLENKSPSRKAGELDNRGSHYFLARFWAEALAEQREDRPLRERFADVARKLSRNENQIIAELNGIQGKPVDIGGYYHPDEARTSAAMRPCELLNGIIDAIA